MTPLYLRAAYIELGVREIPGAGSAARVLEYHRATTLGASDDAVPWCAAFVCWCLAEGGIAHPATARAREFLRWGRQEQYPEPGAIVVLRRGRLPQPPASVLDAPGHVGFFVGFREHSELLLLGGNQGDRVGIDAFPISEVLGYRVPA